MRRKISTLLLTTLIFLSFCTTAFAANLNAPNIVGKSAIVVDAKTGEVIYTKDVDTSPMYPASTTKLLTALLLAENKQPTDILTYTNGASKQPEYTLRSFLKGQLKVGDKMSADDAMKGLLLHSANDIAYMIADNVAGNVDNFAKMMNDKIKKLGLTHTHFVTPNGLDTGITDHYTSAYDLSVIGKAAYENEWVRKTMNLKKDKIELTNGVLGYPENRNKLLGQTLDSKIGINIKNVPVSNAVCIGGKTGYTSKAGRCLVAMFNKDGRILIGVVMKSAYDKNDTYVFNDMVKIVNWAYSAKQVPLYKADTELKTLSIKYRPLKFFGPTKTINIPVTVKEDVTYYDNEFNKAETKTEFELPDIDIGIGKLSKNKSIGKLVLKQRTATKTYDLYPTISSSGLIKDNILLYLGLGIGCIVVIGLIIFISKFISNKFRRGRRNKRMF
ncbi:D-alanyl-D-alanine carboxypeptidase family protein [Clostridium botulinum]|uniref:D-alanyl-D-alanine carboxypeptidase family protein n=1 Tax=Clostridium botulinum TaxID=1491 RepID=UPI0004D54A1C|nr:D-alanyl-D-alanine carboxypeptidase [Clostridium botulinum]KEI04619.1 D-alanyl-D-alanine carboxypeptidase [Clostridium botulinum C/D str. BKT75002]KEI06072.1 D-alanyl-D-alanine carboxypeptidase [Clostridium botulinum C/D str. BKT2873]MCD3350502.1 D-alanyl-D-alanine carboxypeptidase [Clostridium botulinum D/C]MCD3359521.1 D-alanyl-D-alanine carboxypeptidase [Clostridium botulinum D/C]MCD3363250.1 D-alanyl-D-alanine carboxypeptidase [Clostridium botulinum D/C]